jgi:hypothetical protein
MNETGSLSRPMVSILMTFTLRLSDSVKERTHSPNKYNTNKLTSDAYWADACVVAISVNASCIVLTKVLLTEVNACGTVITCETLSTAAVIAIHPIDTYFVVWTTCLKTVINILLTIMTVKSYQTKQNMTSVEYHTTEYVLEMCIWCRTCKCEENRCMPYLAEYKEVRKILFLNHAQEAATHNKIKAKF